MAESFPDFLLHWASAAPDRPFLREAETGRTLTYGGCAALAARFRRRLREAGALPGDRVALVAENSAAWVVAWLGAMAHGAVPVPMNTRQAEGELGALLDDCDPAVIVADARYAGMVPEVRRRAVVPADDLPDATGRGLDGSEARGPALGAICYTSGTTGRPRGVMLRHDRLAACAATFAGLFHAGPDSVTPVTVPLFHNTGYVDGLGHMLVAGGRVDLYRRFDAARVGEAIYSGEYGYAVAVPTMYARMAEALEGRPPSTAAPWLAYGGAPMPRPVAERFAALAPRAFLVNVYGMSEATSITHYLPWRPGTRDLAAIGAPSPGTLDRIAPDGELLIDSPTAMTGYWNDPAATAAKYDGRWLKSGDLARRGEDGFLRIVGRADDLINRGGEKIVPGEVEEAILAHPLVVEAAVVALPHRDLGQVAGAAVVLREGAELDGAALARFLAERIADFKRPAALRFVDALPKNPNGKILRQAVAALLMEG